MSPIERTFEAECPKQGTPVGTAITSQRVIAHATEVQENAFCSLGSKARAAVACDTTPEPRRSAGLLSLERGP